MHDTIQKPQIKHTFSKYNPGEKGLAWAEAESLKTDRCKSWSRRKVERNRMPGVKTGQRTGKKYLAQTKWSHLSFTLCHYIFPFWTDHMSNEENCLIEGRSTSFHSNHWLFCKYERYPVHFLVFASEWKHDWWLKALHSRGLEGLGRILLCFRNGFNCQT